MPRRLLLFAVVALATAAACVRLGFWQLSRLHERRAINAVVASRLRMPEATTLAAIPADTAEARFRRVRLRGRYDYEHEVRLTGRSRNGSPGVNVITPLRLPDTNVAVLVNRGWVYSPNGADADLARWREGDSATVVGFVNPLGARHGDARSASARRGSVRWIDDRAMARDAGYPVTPYTVVQQGDSAPAGSPRADSVPARLDVPPLDEGPHLSYAFQWFSVAAIALVGIGIFIARTSRDGR
jgi:surfeit locus 1 family protein